MTYDELALRLSEVAIAIAGQPRICSTADCESIGKIAALSKRIGMNSASEIAFAIAHAPSRSAAESMMGAFNEGARCEARMGETPIELSYAEAN